jgi:hypothetical protein
MKIMKKKYRLAEQLLDIPKTTPYRIFDPPWIQIHLKSNYKSTLTKSNINIIKTKNLLPTTKKTK